MNNLISVHIADLHFGKIDPNTEYKILEDQFLNKILKLPRIDLIAVNGDIFDHKLMANSNSVRYAIKFIDELAHISCIKQATIIIIKGTDSHDAGQTKLFYQYMEDKSIDFRIVETIKFEETHGARILCIPELYNIDESIYQYYFHQSGWYDLALIHGTFEGSVYGNNVIGEGRLLTKADFSHCKGLCTSGHVHVPGSFGGFYYYCGAPIRWQFGEESPKGYLISNQDLDTGIHYVEFEEITSFKYDTIYLDQLISEDPKMIIDYINNIKQTQGIEFIRVMFRYNITGSNKTIINNYYRNDPAVTIEFTDSTVLKNEAQLQESINANEQYSYFTDEKISDFERFVRFVNDSEGYQYITVEQLTNLLSNKDL